MGIRVSRVTTWVALNSPSVLPDPQETRTGTRAIRKRPIVAALRRVQGTTSNMTLLQGAADPVGVLKTPSPRDGGLVPNSEPVILIGRYPPTKAFPGRIQVSSKPDLDSGTRQ